MKLWGFVRGVYNPCLYYSPLTGLQTMVHGDDFASVGSREAAKKFRKQLDKRFETKAQVIGIREEEGEVKEARVLNRIIRVVAEGWVYEADQRHADLIVEALGLTEANSAKTPCEDEKEWEREENEERLEPTEATRYRGIAARCNYLSADMPDMMFATKEVCRRMANPTVGAYKRLKRLGRYLPT